MDSIELPQQDTTAFLDDFRSAQLSHLLVAAITEFDVGKELADGSLEYDELKKRLKLQERAAMVLLTGLRSLRLIDVNAHGHVELTDYGREKLDPHSRFHLRGYVGLGAVSADVQHMVQCLREDRPVGDVSFVYHDDGTPSALDDEAAANLLTRAMADRAKSVAPHLASRLDLDPQSHLVDVGGGHGLYSYYLLQKYPGMRATIVDRAPPLSVAKDFANKMGVRERVELICSDAHQWAAPTPPDVVLMANLLHDYDVVDSANLVAHFAGQLAPGGRLLVMDAMLNSVESTACPISDGPRPVAAYSALLFTICEGRCYRQDEVESWLTAAGLVLEPAVVGLPAHTMVLGGQKMS